MFPNPMEEIQKHEKELRGHRVRLYVVDEKQEKPLKPRKKYLPEESETKTLFERFQGHFGRFRSGSSGSIAKNHKEEFIKILEEKHRKGHL